MNTHIFSSVVPAQIDFLEQLSDEEFWEYAQKLAYAAPPGAYPHEYLECILHQGRCLIPLTALYQVASPPHILTQLPALPSWALGVTAWRGEVIACIDLAAYLSNNPTSLSPQQGILREGILLIVQHTDLPLALLIPAIGKTVPLSDEQEHPTLTLPSWYASTRVACVQQMQGETLVLDIPALLTDVIQQLEIAVIHE